jgi:hypothetical protein
LVSSGMPAVILLCSVDPEHRQHALELIVISLLLLWGWIVAITA